MLSTSDFVRIFLHKGAAVCLIPLDRKEPLTAWLDSPIRISKRLASKVLVLGIGGREHQWPEAELQVARRKRGFQSITFGSVSLQAKSLLVPAATSEWKAFLRQAERILEGLEESPVAKDPDSYRQQRNDGAAGS